MRRLVITVIASLAAVAAVPSAAFANPSLISASPADGSTVSKPTRLTLTFSETLAASNASIELTMTAMPGMTNHKPMPIRGFTTTVSGKNLVATLPRPLPAGTYQLKWRVGTSTQQSIEGAYSFAVR